MRASHANLFSVGPVYDGYDAMHFMTSSLIVLLKMLRPVIFGTTVFAAVFVKINIGVIVPVVDSTTASSPFSVSANLTCQCTTLYTVFTYVASLAFPVVEVSSQHSSAFHQL